MGVPVIGCSCDVCTSLDARNHRLRTSALLTCDAGAFLLDPGPDFRLQALRFGLENHGNHSLKGVLVTHTHSDHVAGIDDLRIFNFKQQRAMPLLVSQTAHLDLRARYGYLIDPQESEGSSMASRLDFRILPSTIGKINFEGLDVDYCTYFQGNTPVLGYRMGPLAYITDIKHYGEDLLEFIRDVRFLILSAGGMHHNRMHLLMEESIELAKASGAIETYFIHLNHEIDFVQWQNKLPKGMYLGYDGLCIDMIR